MDSTQAGAAGTARGDGSRGDGGDGMGELPAREAREAGPEGPGIVRGTLGPVRIGAIWLAANLVVTTLLTGTLFVPGVRYGEALLWIAAGTLAGTVVLTLVAVMGARTGLATMQLTRASFGAGGSIVPSASNLVILMGWSWVQAMLAGISLDALLLTFTGFSNPVLCAALCQLVVVGLAILGHAGIERIQPLLGLAILAFMAAVFVIAFTAHPPADYFAIPADPAAGMTGAGVFDIVFATAISWTVLSADLTRTARSPRAGAAGAATGYASSTVLAMTLGATAAGFIILGGGEAAPFDPAAVIGAFGPPAALVMFLSVMATNTMVMYGMTVSLQHALPGRRPMRFLPAALVLGAVSIAGATQLALLEQFTSFLSLIGALFIPVFAIMIADHYVLRRGRHPVHRENADPREWNIRAIGSWVLGAVSYWLLAFAWPSPIGAALPALLVSGVCFFAWSRLAPARAPGGR